MTLKLAILAGAIALADISAHARNPQEEENLRLAIEFYDAALNAKNWEDTAPYLGPRYGQHSIYMEDQNAGLRSLVDRINREHPDNRGEVKRVLVQGDMVIMHIHVTRHEGHPGWSVFEMIRFEDGKAVEHWDMFRALATEADAGVVF